MRTFAGLAMVIVGAAVGIYCGFWWAFIGGIVDVVREIRSDDLNALSLAIGIAIGEVFGLDWLDGGWRRYCAWMDNSEVILREQQLGGHHSA